MLFFCFVLFLCLFFFLFSLKITGTRSQVEKLSFHVQNSFVDKCQFAFFFFYPFLMACVPTSNFVRGEASGSVGRRAEVSASSRSESHRITRSDFSCTPFSPAFVFYFSCRCEWSVALGINDMTRDTLLLEFSQVRATPIEEARVAFCSASCGNQESPSLFSSVFLKKNNNLACSFNIAEKERWIQKGLLKEI